MRLLKKSYLFIFCFLILEGCQHASSAGDDSETNSSTDSYTESGVDSETLTAADSDSETSVFGNWEFVNDSQNNEVTNLFFDDPPQISITQTGNELINIYNNCFYYHSTIEINSGSKISFFKIEPSSVPVLPNKATADCSADMPDVQPEWDSFIEKLKNISSYKITNETILLFDDTGAAILEFTKYNN